MSPLPDKTTATRLILPVTPMFIQNRALLEPLADAIEFKGAALDCDTGKGAVFHSHINVAYPRFAEAFAEGGIAEFMTRRGLRDFSFHIGLSDDSYPFIPIVHERLEGRAMTRAEILAAAEKSISFLKESIDGVIAGENLDYIEGGAYENVCEPDFIADFVERFDIAFLLDIGHLLVSSRHLRVEPNDYLAALPLERTSEIHFHKPVEVDGVWRDLHDLPGDAEYSLLEAALERARPDFINLECYSNPDLVAEHLARLRSMLL